MSTRGFENNNPGNVDRTSIKWAGMAPVQSDPRFIVFVDAAHGFRCMARIIHGHFRTFNTVRSIITRWAPGVENNTEAYIADVAGRMGIDAGVPFTWADHALPLLRAIATHENGSPCLWADSDIVAGIQLEATT